MAKFFLLLVVFLFLGDLEVDCSPLTIMTRPASQNNYGKPWEHEAVMRSLKTGLSLSSIPFIYNPTSINAITGVVMVVCNSDALNQGIKLKKDKRIKKLIVGPNFYPHDVNFPEVDVYLVPSSPIIETCSVFAPELAPRCRVWYVGVDHNFWRQQSNEYRSSKNVLVYWKTEAEDFCIKVETLLKKYGWNPFRIRYGYYKPNGYKNLLSLCRFAVFISVSESQGIALAEAWSMDIPTFPWNPMDAKILGRRFTCVPSCPYLTSKQGLAWKTFEDFEKILQHIDSLLPTFSPRSWVLENMTDLISAQLLAKIIDDLS